MDQDFLAELEALEDEAAGAFAVPTAENLDEIRERVSRRILPEISREKSGQELTNFKPKTNSDETRSIPPTQPT